MKKIVCLLMALTMLLALFAGCGKAEEPAPTAAPTVKEEPAAPAAKEEPAAPAEKIKLVGMCWGNPGTLEATTAEFMAANPEIAEKYEISWVVGGQNGQEVASKVRLALSANENVCDFVIMNYPMVPEFARAGALVDVSAALAKYDGELTNASLALSSYEGQTVGIPLKSNAKVWFYRQDIFAECGVDVAAIKNVDDFIAAGKKIQEKYPNSYMWNLGATPQAYQYYLTLSGNGARFYDADGNYNIASDPGTIKMLEDYKKMVDAGIISNVCDWTTDWERALADGTLVSQPCAGWLGEGQFLPTYSGEANKGNWAVTAWPEIGGATGGSDDGGSVIVVPTFSSNPEAAAEYVAAYTLSESGSKIVARANVAPPNNKKAMEDKSVFADQAAGYFGPTLMDAQYAAMDSLRVFSVSPNHSAELGIVVEYFTKAVYGEMTIADALAAAEADMQTVIGNAFD